MSFSVQRLNRLWKRLRQLQQRRVAGDIPSPHSNLSRACGSL